LVRKVYSRCWAVVPAKRLVPIAFLGNHTYQCFVINIWSLTFVPTLSPVAAAPSSISPTFSPAGYTTFCYEVLKNSLKTIEAEEATSQAAGKVSTYAREKFMEHMKNT